MKRTKKFNQEWAQAIALMPYNLQQSITDAIRSYQNDGVMPVGLHPVVEALFIVIKPTIDARARRSAYQKERRKRLNRSCLRPTPQEVSKPQEAPKPAPADALPLHEAPATAAVEKPKEKAAPLKSNNFLRQIEKARERQSGQKKEERRVKHSSSVFSRKGVLKSKSQCHLN